jgi:hypothetical protein
MWRTSTLTSILWGKSRHRFTSATIFSSLSRKKEDEIEIAGEKEVE